jgi:hypothetical protein
VEVRLVAASTIFRGACALHGQPWSHRAGEDSLSVSDFRMIRSVLSNRLNIVWHSFPWPALVETKNRRRLQKLYEAQLFHPGDIVQDPVSNACYVCVSGTKTLEDTPAEHPELWARLGDFPILTTNDQNARFKIGDRVLNPRDATVCYVKQDGALYMNLPDEPGFYTLPEWHPEFPLVDDFQTPMEEVLGVWADRTCHQ